MDIVFNGGAVEVAAATVLELLREMGLGTERLAVERNLTMVPRRLWPETRLKAGDRIEVVQMVGGGR